MPSEARRRETLKTKLKPPEGCEPVSVPYDMSLSLVCAAHSEHNAVGTCPHPDCPNGLPAAQEWIVTIPPFLEETFFRRTRWDMGQGGETWSWQQYEGCYLSIQRIFWREAQRSGWIPQWPDGGRGFQYTSLDGFLGMLRSNELWLSDYSYLNDAAELTHGAAKAQVILDGVGSQRPGSRELLRAQGRSDFSKHRVCIASFSMEPDSLSQWRGYGPIAVGFELSGLGFGYNNTTRVGPVVYDPAAQDAMLELWANLNTSAWERESESEKRRLQSLYYEASDNLLELIAFFKNSGFSDERELRIVHTESSRDAELFGMKPSPEKFRVSGGLIVPYLTTRDLTDEPPERLPIVEVVVGPGPKMDSLVSGVKRALAAHGYDVPVNTSKTTYRQ